MARKWHKFKNEKKKTIEQILEVCPKESDDAFLFLGSMTSIIRSIWILQMLRMMDIIVLILHITSFFIGRYNYIIKNTLIMNWTQNLLITKTDNITTDP